MSITRKLQIIRGLLDRNSYGLGDVPSKKNHVNIESYPLCNIGDTLGPVIVKWMLGKENINSDVFTKKTKHLMSVGSVTSFGRFDSTIWGSGILNNNAIRKIKQKHMFYNRKLDVRSVRGPITRDALICGGYKCPKIFGDPAILLPLIYSPDKRIISHEVSLILHHLTSCTSQKSDSDRQAIHYQNSDIIEKYKLNIIDPKTNDYRWFVDNIVSSKLVISSSLHGIIIAEAYGVPCIYLSYGITEQSLKFQDWFSSTNRECVGCESIEKALISKPNELPDLHRMRIKLMDSFPYDLWED